MKTEMNNEVCDGITREEYVRSIRNMINSSNIPIEKLAFVFYFMRAATKRATSK